MKKFKAIVNHTGSCSGEHYKAGKEVILTEHVVKALGEDVNVIEEIKEEEKPQDKIEEKTEKKEAKKPFNKMVEKEEATTK